MTQLKQTNILSAQALPPEYEDMPENKEELARRIALHRQRLLLEGKKAKAALVEQEVVPDLLNNYLEGVPAQAVNFVRHNPKISLLCGVGGLVAISWALRRTGTKRLMRSVSVVSPFIMDYLEYRHRRDE